MKKIIASIAARAAIALPVIASASTWNIDPDHSNVGFKVRHLMVSNVKGTFEKHSGVLELNDKDITKSKVSVTIDTASDQGEVTIFLKQNSPPGMPVGSFVVELISGRLLLFPAMESPNRS